MKWVEIPKGQAIFSRRDDGTWEMCRSGGEDGLRLPLHREDELLAVPPFEARLRFSSLKSVESSARLKAADSTLGS